MQKSKRSVKEDIVLYCFFGVFLLIALLAFGYQLGMIFSTAPAPAVVYQEISVPENTKIVFESCSDSSGGVTYLEMSEWNALFSKHAYWGVPLLCISSESKSAYQVTVAHILPRTRDRSFVAYEYIPNPFRENEGFWKPSVHLEGKHTLVLTPVRKVFDPNNFVVMMIGLFICVAIILLFRIGKKHDVVQPKAVAAI